jgi:hypothetical protein
MLKLISLNSLSIKNKTIIKEFNSKVTIMKINKRHCLNLNLRNKTHKINRLRKI